MAWARNLVRMLVLAVALSLVSGIALPAFARAIVGESHVCHCKVSEHDCVCARCNPERPDFWLTTPSLKGQCGEDEGFAAGARMPGVLPPIVTDLPAPVAARLPLPTPIRMRSAPPRPPPAPPPRSV